MWKELPMNGFLRGRRATDREARLWHMELAPFEFAWDVFMQSTGFICVEHIAERTEYKQLKRFYNWLTRIDSDELIKLLQKYSPLVSFDYASSNLTEENLVNNLLSYPKPAVEAGFRYFRNKKHSHLLPEEFIEQCRIEYFKKIDAEVPEESSWFNRLPVIEVVTTTECVHHCDKPYCYMMRYERDSDIITDPIRTETLENIMAWETQMEEEFELG